MNKDEIKSCKQLNKKDSLVTFSSQIKTVREERRFQVLLLLLPLLLLLSMQMYNHNYSQYLSHLIPYQNTSLKKTNVIVSRGKENKQRQELFINLPSQHWPTASLPYLIHNIVVSYFPDEIADNIFD